MFDRHTTALIRPVLEGLARRLVRWGVGADALSFAGLALGWSAAAAIALRAHWLGAVLILLSRLLDGLDGAVARATSPTDRGGFLDIVLDFVVYSGMVFAFAVLDPARNALPAAFLVFAFVGTGTSFLAFAVMAAKRGLTTEARGRKSLYYLGGLTEGGETVACLALFCLWPAAFPALAWAFGALCWLTTLARVLTGVRTLA
jgi:phosphatidylglycerophosphate synthase